MTPTARRKSPFARLLELLTRVGTHPEESDDEKLAKATLTLFSLLMCMGGLMWGTAALLLDRPYQSLIPFSYTTIVGTSVVWFGFTRRYRVFRFVQLLLGLILPFLCQWTLGGYASTGAIMLWAVVAPLGALMFAGVRASAVWASAYLLLIVASSVADPFVKELVAPLPENLQGVLYLMNIGSVSSMIYFAITYFITQNLRIRADLVAQKSIIEEQSQRLVELDVLKTDFFNNISHEFRTPITLTLGPVEGMLNGRYGEVSEGVTQQLRIIWRNQQRLLGLINQILDLAKFDQDKMELQAAPCPAINQLVESLAEPFRSVLEERGITLELALDPLASDIDVYLDLDKFEKCVYNLLSNANKFTQQGAIRIATQVGPDHLFLQVKDTGVGIRADQLEHIFDRFRQADGSMSRDHSGTGIGLALAREVVELHGGVIHAESEYGQGSTFTIAIPLGSDHLDPASIAAEARVAPADRQALVQASVDRGEVVDHRSIEQVEELNRQTWEHYSRKQPTILFVDDSADLRAYVRDLLTGAGYNVYLAVDGRDGLDKARLLYPDLILSDLMMPEMTGLELCAAVRAEPELMDLPFVLLTARAQLDAKLAVLEHGADDYLTKPFATEELLARVKNLVLLRDRHRRLKEELQAAREIQRSMLPPLPLRHGAMEIRAIYHPSAELSGDCFDFHEGDDGSIYFYLADVTSHGTAAAQVTYLIKQIFTKVVERHRAPSLSTLLKEMHSDYGQYQLAYDVTIQIGRFNARDMVLEYACGGAPPALRVVDQACSVVSITPVPVLTAATRTEVADKQFDNVRTIQMNPGEAIYFFTDGCYEFSAQGKMFGMRRLSRLLGSGSEPWEDTVLRGLIAARGSKQFDDDLTILRLQVGSGRKELSPAKGA